MWWWKRTIYTVYTYIIYTHMWYIYIFIYLRIITQVDHNLYLFIFRDLLLDFNAGCQSGVKPRGPSPSSKCPSRWTMWGFLVPHCCCFIIFWKQPDCCTGLEGDMAFPAAHTHVQTHTDTDTHRGLISGIDTVAWRTATDLSLILCLRGNVATEAENGKLNVALAL